MRKKALTEVEKKRLVRLNEELKRIINVLIDDYNPQKIILFGSLVDGNIHEYSDIDLVVIKESDKNFYERLKEVGFLVLPNIAADIIVYTPEEIEKNKESNYFIREQILKKGKVLYDAQQQVV